MELLSKTIVDALYNAKSDLQIDDEDIGFWEVSDYGIFVLLTEQFYKTLNYRKADPAEFCERKKYGDLPHVNSYRDSRSYMRIILEHFEQSGLDPCIVDVGGYIGRFSIETAIFLREQQINTPVYCLEPGLTRSIIRANLLMNDVNAQVHLMSEAASSSNGSSTYKYSPDGLISGRIGEYRSASKNYTVRTLRLDSLISEIRCADAAIIKIDTEGHEPDVMAGLGDVVRMMPNVCIVEFWPVSLKEAVNNVPYADYIESNFVVLDIKSSLYPREYKLISDINKYAENFDEAEGNIDLMFISRNMPNMELLLSKLKMLANPGARPAMLGRQA